VVYTKDHCDFCVMVIYVVLFGVNKCLNVVGYKIRKIDKDILMCYRVLIKMIKKRRNLVGKCWKFYNW
jgi:hypothetical protein